MREITFRLTLEKDEQGYIARFPDLDLYGVGDTEAQAKESLIIATDITVQHCLKEGTLDEIFCDIKLVSKEFPDEGWDPILAAEKYLDEVVYDAGFY